MASYRAETSRAPRTLRKLRRLVTETRTPTAIYICTKAGEEGLKYIVGFYITSGFTRLLQVQTLSPVWQTSALVWVIQMNASKFHLQCNAINIHF